jgi:hypothetical protein
MRGRLSGTGDRADGSPAWRRCQRLSPDVDGHGVDTGNGGFSFVAGAPRVRAKRWCRRRTRPWQASRECGGGGASRIARGGCLWKWRRRRAPGTARPRSPRARLAFAQNDGAGGGRVPGRRPGSAAAGASLAGDPGVRRRARLEFAQKDGAGGGRRERRVLVSRGRGSRSRRRMVPAAGARVVSRVAAVCGNGAADTLRNRRPRGSGGADANHIARGGCLWKRRRRHAAEPTAEGKRADRPSVAGGAGWGPVPRARCEP